MTLAEAYFDALTDWKGTYLLRALGGRQITTDWRLYRDSVWCDTRAVRSATTRSQIHDRPTIRVHRYSTEVSHTRWVDVATGKTVLRSRAVLRGEA